MKPCTRCGVEKPLSEFHRRHRGALDGRQSQCKDCDRDRRLAYPQRRKSDFSGPRRRHPERARARGLVARAVRTGRLRPAKDFPCTDCGGPALDYDHHLGYDEPHRMDVQPVCRRCHGLRTRRVG